jgi:RHS repeat-associated protein
VGGLLARSEWTVTSPQPSTSYYLSDAGGNVTALVDGEGEAVADYTYDPYGNLIRRGGNLAEQNTLRYSSKEYHARSGLCYYGFRFYDPNLQRWLNEDPIGERGGINLHRFVSNDPLGRVDPLGLAFSYYAEPGSIGDMVSEGIPGPMPYVKSEGWGNDVWYDYPLGMLNNGLATVGNSLYQFTRFAGYIGGTVEGFINGTQDFGERFGEAAASAWLMRAPIGKPCAAKTPASLWTKAEFNGTRVYQRNDLIDAALVDARGRSNLQRMQQGLAPIGPDGKSINLHHTIQTADSPLAEMTATFHQQNSAVIHINPNTIPSGINRPAFDAFRRDYWINRANDFSP